MRNFTQELAYGEFKSSTEEQVLTLNLRMMFRDTGKNQDYNKVLQIQKIQIKWQ